MGSAHVLCAALLLLASLGVVAPQLAGTASCATDLVRLLPCLPYIDGATAVPPDTCCTNLGSMVHDEPQCLCQALSQPGASPVAVNMSRVLGMPRLCRLDIPSAADACRGLLPQGGSPPPPPLVIPPRPNVTYTVPSTLSPAPPTAPRTAPLVTAQTPPPGYSKGGKVVVDLLSVALGFVALVSLQAF